MNNVILDPIFVTELVLHTSGYVGMIALTKVLLTEQGMPYPLFITALDQALVFVLLSAARVAQHALAGVPARPAVEPLSDVSSVYVIFEQGLLAILNIGTGAFYFEAHLYLFPSFNEMIQMTAPVLQIAANVLVLRKPTSLLAGCMAPVIVCGGILCSFGEVNYSSIGVAFSILAMLCRVSRISLAQVMLERQGHAVSQGVSQPGLKLARDTAGLNAVGLLILSAVIEHSAPWRGLHKVTSRGSLGFLIMKGICTCAWYTTEFLLIGRAGAVATAFVANVNRVCSVAFSLELFGNPVTPLQWAGFGLTLGGVSGILYDKAHDASYEEVVEENEVENDEGDALTE